MEEFTSKLIEILGKILSYWAFSLIFISIVLNTLACIICLSSKQLRSVNTFKMLAIMAISDLLQSLTWNYENFLYTLYGLISPFNSLFFCKFFSMFIQYVSMAFSNWILVSISFDRVMSLCVKKWDRQYFKGNRPFVYLAFLAILFIAININSIFNAGYIHSSTNSSEIQCYISSDGSYNWTGTQSKVFNLLISLFLMIYFIRKI